MVPQKQVQLLLVGQTAHLPEYGELMLQLGNLLHDLLIFIAIDLHPTQSTSCSTILMYSSALPWLLEDYFGEFEEVIRPNSYICYVIWLYTIEKSGVIRWSVIEVLELPTAVVWGSVVMLFVSVVWNVWVVWVVSGPMVIVVISLLRTEVVETVLFTTLLDCLDRRSHPFLLLLVKTMDIGNLEISQIESVSWFLLFWRLVFRSEEVAWVMRFLMEKGAVCIGWGLGLLKEGILFLRLLWIVTVQVLAVKANIYPLRLKIWLSRLLFSQRITLKVVMLVL